MLDPNTAATLTLDQIDELCDELTRAHGDALPPALRATGGARDRRSSPGRPGRVNLIGEHTDYSGGLVLPARSSSASGSTCVRAPRDRRCPRCSPASRAVRLRRQRPAGHGWARYPQAVAAELHALGRPPIGFEGVVHSDLPTGAGLSSSAALEVAVALALCEVAGFALDPLELALACQRAELRAVGVPCGILDQAACSARPCGRGACCSTAARSSTA